MILENEVENVK